MFPPWNRRPPAGHPVPLAGAWGRLRSPGPGEALAAALGKELGGAGVSLHASGREAMRCALAHLAARSGRLEVLVPAYTCFSVPASAAAAGLKVRLVEVTPEGRVDPRALERLPLERACALVVGNLFGVAEALEPLRRRVAEAGVALVDDAAQALGATHREGPVGARGELGILSFGRGKPLSALGGGAIVWPSEPEVAAQPGTAQPLFALLKAALYDLALHPAAFGVLASLPGLGIGETHFDPGFARGPIDGTAACLGRDALARREPERRARAARATALAARVSDETGFRPLLADSGEEGAYPRLAVVAPTAADRDAALAEAAVLGASVLYPCSLDALRELAPHRAGEGACPVARELAPRVLTLPTHRELAPGEQDALIAALRRAPGGPPPR